MMWTIFDGVRWLCLVESPDGPRATWVEDRASALTWDDRKCAELVMAVFCGEGAADVIKLDE